VAREDESDDCDSDFDFEDEDEDDSDTSFVSVRKLPYKRTSRVDATRFDDREEVERRMLAAATEASIRDFMSRGASTSAGSSGHNISRPAGLAATTEFYYVDSDIVPDSEPEGDLLEPIVQTGWISKGKGRNKSQWKSESDADHNHQEVYTVRRETRTRSALEKQERRRLEFKLGRRLTYVGLAGIFLDLSILVSYLTLTQAEKSTIQLHKHHPELRDAWGDLEAAIGIVEPKKAEQPSGLRITLLPFQEESLYWMRNQEFGQYAGGLLAVSLAHLLK